MAIDLRLEEQTQARVIDSLVTRGDISALDPQERAAYYIEYCKQLGLNPASNPLAILRLNGKEVLYPTRGATDQLAAIHRLNREVIEGPEIRDFGGTKLLYCKVKVSHPNGRVETALATLPARVDENSLMKLETKAKRRGTLSILGLGMLDETEIEAIPASAKEPAQQVDVRVVESKQRTATTEELFRDALLKADPPDMWSCAEIWTKYEPLLREEANQEQLHELQLEAKGRAEDATSMQAWKWAVQVTEAAHEHELVKSSLGVHLRADDAADFVLSWRGKKDAIAALGPELAKMCWELHWRGYCRITKIAPRQEPFKKALGITDPEDPKGKKTAPQPAPASAEGGSADAAPAEGAQASVSYLVPNLESARYVASADLWQSHCMGFRNRTHALNSWGKHFTAFRAAGEQIYAARLHTIAEWLQADAKAINVEVCKNAFLNAERTAENNARKHAEEAATLRKVG